jgi:glucose/arabinose dehydrogenase
MRRLHSIVCGAALLACSSAPQRSAEPSVRPVRQGTVQCAYDNGGLVLPTGFCAIIAHNGVGRARHIAVAPNGNVYVALSQPSGAGSIVALRDADGDGRLDEEVRFGDVGGTGMAVRGGRLYFGANTFIVRYRLVEDRLGPVGEPDTVVRGFPEQRAHASKAIAFDASGNLYVNVGGPSNACQTQDRQAGSPGMDPCPELGRQMGIWRFDVTRSRQVQTDGRRYASGIRNANALDWNPNDNTLYVVQHGRDQLNTIAPNIFDERANAEKPAEEMLRVNDGDTFGHPYCFYDPALRRRVLAPEYGGDGTSVGRCARFEDPVAVYPAHYAPNDLIFYRGFHFPARYRGGAFIAFHGSWNRAPLEQRGYQVVFQPFAGANPSGEAEMFADGFAGRTPIPQPNAAAHRPVGLAEAPDGTLYIVDSVAGRIWRVLWRG